MGWIDLKKPNILFILTDDQRYNTIHALGNEEIITPNMDKLVKRGMSFTNAHIPSGTSGAVCMPSRAMLNTGRSLFRIQGEGQDIPVEHKTIGETLRQFGYDCYGTGKWHNGPPAFTRSFRNGDNIFFGGMWDHWNVPVNRYDPTGEYDNVINFVGNFGYNNGITEVHCDKFNPGVHSSQLLTDTAVEYINHKPDDGKPFYLYTAYLAPHDPRTMPEHFKNMYDPDKITLPENYMSEHPFDFGVFDIRDEVLAAYPRQESEVRRHLAEYYGMITHLDSEIGRILDALEAKGEMDNTLIVLAGDNGLAVGCHGLMGKQNHYDHSIRVPLLLSGPGIPQNVCCDNYVYLYDVFPTLCDLIGCEIPSSVEGKSFAAMIQDTSVKTRETLYFAYCDMIRSIKDSRYKLIEYRNPIKKTQLFDLLEDPCEIHDLSEEPSYAGIVAKLRNLLISQGKEFEHISDHPHPDTLSYWDNF